jgi:multiple sugar transport system substrate-binding protein
MNGTTIWFQARRDKHPNLDDIGLALLPSGPEGRALFVLNQSYAIMRYSRVIDSAKAFVRWSLQDSTWLPWFETNEGYVSGVGPKQDASPIWDKLPEPTRIFKSVGPATRTPGFAGPYSARATLAQARYIVVDMFARAVQGETPEAAVAWAESELERVYV